MARRKTKTILESIRKPIAPPGRFHSGKKAGRGYDRRRAKDELRKIRRETP